MRPREVGDTDDIEEQYWRHRWAYIVDYNRNELAPLGAVLGRLHDFLSEDFPQLLLDSYSCCERLGNLMDWVRLGLPEGKRERYHPVIRSFVQRTIDHVRLNLEFYGPKTNNHILNNGRALVIAGSLLENRDLLRLGVRLLERMLPVLVREGGFLREQSSHYQLVVLGWLLDVVFFLESSETRLEEKEGREIYVMVQRMCEAASCLVNEKGRLRTRIGDVSPDRTPLESCARLSNLYPTYWEVIRDESVTDTVVGEWGFTRRGESAVIANCPDQAVSDFSTHGHNHHTSFVWEWGNEEILCDLGRFRYTKDPVSLRQQHGAAHNLITVDGLAPACESIVSGAEVTPLPYGEAGFSLQLDDDGRLQIEHDGYDRATDVCRHVRAVTVSKRELQVVDELEGEGDALIEWMWHFAPGWGLVSKAPLRLARENKQVTVDFKGNGGKGGIKWLRSESSGFWYTPEYGERLQCGTVIVKRRTSLPFKLLTSFRLD